MGKSAAMEMLLAASGATLLTMLACWKLSKRDQRVRSTLKEYSVVYTDRALNLMAAPFCTVMTDISRMLKQVYNAHSVAIIPGSGTYGMEAVARQFANKKHVLVVRNGYFSFRWSDIFDMCGIPASHTVIKGRASSDKKHAGILPPTIKEIVEAIKSEKPAAVFAPHVETSTGVILPEAYIKAIGDATHSVGGLFVLDCIASGTVWVDMKALSIDVVISAPQKGWSGPACAGYVMMSEKATQATKDSESDSFSVNLGRWLDVMETYEKGGFKYYTTLPTDALAEARNAMVETVDFGLENARWAMLDLGAKVRALLESRGYPSVAAKGFEAPGVVSSYTDDAQIVGKLKAAGIQVAAGVPFKLEGNAPDATCFRIGLFGLDKLKNVDRTVAILEKALDSCQ